MLFRLFICILTSLWKVCFTIFLLFHTVTLWHLWFMAPLNIPVQTESRVQHIFFVVYSACVVWEKQKGNRRRSSEQLTFIQPERLNAFTDSHNTELPSGNRLVHSCFLLCGVLEKIRPLVFSTNLEQWIYTLILSLTCSSQSALKHLQPDLWGSIIPSFLLPFTDFL